MAIGPRITTLESRFTEEDASRSQGGPEALVCTTKNTGKHKKKEKRFSNTVSPDPCPFTFPQIP
jgi:hypothetical protein